MFAASQFSSVRKPLEEAETLPPVCYHSTEFYNLEVENIFRKKWILIGRADEWKEPGAFTAYERFGVPFFITKDQTGKLRAFSNVCRHRGSQIVSGSGTANTFVCPYHSWVYGLDGSLRRAPGMENRCFDQANYSLPEIRLDIWRSFVFVNFSDDASPLADQLGDIDQYLHSYDFDNVVTVGRDEYVVNTNWKALVENSMEWLHHPTVHKQSIAGKVASVQRRPVYGNPGDYMLIQALAKGVSRATLDNEQGFPPVSTLEGATREGSHYVLIYPFAMLGCDLDSIWYKQMIPEGPCTVRNIATYCFHKETVARPDFEQISPRYFRRFQKVVTEDNVAMERQLVGLKSPFAKPGRFSDPEVLVHRIDNWVLDQIFPATAQGFRMNVLQRGLIPARKGAAVELRKGQSIRVINTYGQQVVDTWAFSSSDMTELMSMEHSRAGMQRLSPRVGDQLLTNRRRPILTLVEDTWGGAHDTLMAACDIYRYQGLGCKGHHDNCTDNLADGLKALGKSAPETPSPLNLFMNIPWTQDGQLSFEKPTTKPGDSVTLQAEMDCIVAFSACPQDMIPINGADCTPRDAHFEILG